MMKKALFTAGLFLLGAQSALFADVYTVTIDTSLLSGPGFIDIQFNPAPGSSAGSYEAGTATISGFQLLGPGAMLGAEEGSLRVSATGDLQPGPLSITNADFTQPNGVFYAANFGTSVKFLLDLSGPAFTSLGQSFLTDFSIGLYGQTDQVVGIATLLGGGAIDTSLSDPRVTFAPQAAVPEPSMLLVLVLAPGAAMLMASRRRRQHTNNAA